MNCIAVLVIRLSVSLLPSKLFGHAPYTPSMSVWHAPYTPSTPFWHTQGSSVTCVHRSDSDSVASCAAAVRVHSHGVVLVTIRTREQLVRQLAVLGNFEVVRTGGMLRIPVCSWARRPRLCSENPASSQPLNPRVRAREWQCIRSNMLIWWWGWDHSLSVLLVGVSY